MRFRDFHDAADFISEQEIEQKKQSMIAAAFTAWQLGAGNNGKTKRTWPEYLRAMGLGDRPRKMSETEKKDAVTKALKVSERIVGLATRGKRRRVNRARSF